MTGNRGPFLLTDLLFVTLLNSIPIQRYDLFGRQFNLSVLLAKKKVYCTVGKKKGPICDDKNDR